MALFSAACRHFAHSAGAKTLHPVPDLNSAERFRPLCLVKRKKSFWIWKKPKITPILVTLNDVVEQKIDASAYTSTNEIMEKYQESPSFTVDGDLGSKIATELDIDMSTVDSFTLTVSFGDIMKTKINWESLERGIQTTKINMNHEIIKELKGKKGKRTSLCIILESLSCKAEGPISGTADEEASGKASSDIKTTVTVDVHMTGKVEEKKHHSFTVPSGTVLAFSCTKLDIKEDGKVTMHVGVDKVDALPPKENLQTKPEDTVDKEIQAALAPLMNTSKYPEFKKAFLGLLTSRESIVEILELVSTAQISVEDGETISLPADIVSKQFGSSTEWQTLLKLLGFVLPDKFTHGSSIEFPKAGSDNLLQACWALAESLTDLTEQEYNLLKDCSQENGKVLLHVIKNGILGNDTPFTDAGVADFVANAKKEVDFLKSLGFTVKEGDKEKLLTFKWVANDSIRDAYTAVYALFSK